MKTPKRQSAPPWVAALSPGAWLIAALALISGVVVLLTPPRDPPGLELWMFSPEHRRMYDPAIDAWQADGGEPVNVSVFSRSALTQRAIGGFFAGVRTADLIEMERQNVGPMFAGPLDSVGFVDLTERVERDGLMDLMNRSSFTPWMSRGRVFGLPHDVHPVLLAYRADIVEDAGIDVSTIETWEDFERVMRPLMTDADADGQPDRYLLGFWPTHDANLEVLLLQGGGALFDANGRCVLATERNAQLLARVVSWCVGQTRIAADVDEFSNAGHQLKIEGYAVAYLMPDWLCGIWMEQIPQLQGKVKLMPLPAFEPGGRRTSVRGGSMMGIPKTSTNVEEAWRFARDLYLSPELTRRLFETNGIVTPVREHWDLPVFDEPQAYFASQATGRLYIEQAPHVPARPASPYYRTAQLRLRDAAIAIAEQANAQGLNAPDQLLPLARDALAQAQQDVERQMARNVFLAEGE